MIYVVQGFYGQGWEDVTASEDRRAALDDLAAYQENEPEYAHRITTEERPQYRV